MSANIHGNQDHPGRLKQPGIFEVKLRGKSLCPKYESTRQINRILSVFKTPRGAMVKKEYLRAHIIRMFRKMIRRYIKGKSIRVKRLKGSQSFSIQYELVESAIKDRITSNLPIFQPISLPQNGPMSDGKLSKTTKKEKVFKSYNNQYVKNFFIREEIKECFFYFIQLIYIGSNFEELEDRLKIKCCSGDHQESCYSAWIRIKNVLLFDLFHNLRIEPWKPSIEDFLLIETDFSSSEKSLESLDLDYFEDPFYID